MNVKIRQSVFPIISAFLWGVAFAVQGLVSNKIAPFAFNFSRSLVATVFLFLVLLATKNTKFLKTVEKTDKKSAIIGGLVCGVCLFFATNLQQIGITVGTNPGVAGFLTSTYMVIIPIMSMFLGKKTDKQVWFAVLIALFGLYLICVTDEFTVKPSDLAVLLCAVMLAVHILVVEKYTKTVDGVLLSLIQFAVVSALSLISSAVFEGNCFAQIVECLLPILYVGVFSSGVAYTLQILAQKDTNPTVVSILLSVESVFAVLSQMVILGVFLSLRELFGCLVVFVAVILCQVDCKKFGIKCKDKLSE